jgi:hypothetical protein
MFRNRPSHRRGKCRTAASAKLFMFREAGTQVSLVTMSLPSPRTTAPPCLPLAIKDSLKEDAGLFALDFLSFELWAFGFWFLAFWMWRLLEVKISVGRLLKSAVNPS